jgi:xylose dehydrogenase (NAD/NADP)
MGDPCRRRVDVHDDDESITRFISHPVSFRDMDLDRIFDEYTDRDWQTRTDGTVRIAMIGLGWWTVEKAMPAVASSDRCETTVLVSGSRQKAGRIADDHDSAEATITYEEFHDGDAADAYDAIYICTPNALHLPYVETAADLGKDVLCEKPMAATVERAEAMTETAETAGITLTIAYRMHTDPAIRCMRRLVEEGFVGEPASLHGQMSQRLLSINDDPDQWRLNPDLAGPGASVTDLGIYSINTSRFVLGADPQQVASFMHSTDREGFRNVPDERAAFTLAFPDGVHATCTASQNTHQSGLFRVTGTEGRLELEPAFFNDHAKTLTLSRADTTAEATFDPVNQMEEEFDHFANHLLEGTEPLPDGHHGLVDMRAIEATYDAAKRGETVAIE